MWNALFFLWVGPETAHFPKTKQQISILHLNHNSHILTFCLETRLFTLHSQRLHRRHWNESCARGKAASRSKCRFIKKTMKNRKKKTTLTIQSHCTFIPRRFHSLPHLWTKGRGRHKEEGQNDVNDVAKM